MAGNGSRCRENTEGTETPGKPGVSVPSVFILRALRV